MEDNGTYSVLLEQHTADEIVRYTDLKQDIKELKEAVAALTIAWNQARGIIYFIKWIAGIAGGLTAVFVFFKDHWK